MHAAMSEMLQDVIEAPEQLSLECISSPVSAQFLDLCDNGNLFTDVPSSSATANSSGLDGSSANATTAPAATATATSSSEICCFEDGSFGSDFSPFPSIDAATLSALLDPQQSPEHDNINVSTDAPSTTMFASYLGDQPEQLVLAETMGMGYSSYSTESDLQLPTSAAQQQQGLQHGYHEDCLPPLPLQYMDSSIAASCSFPDSNILCGFYNAGMGSILPCKTGGDQGSVGFFSGLMGGLDTGPNQELVEYQRTDGTGGVGVYTSESIGHVYSSGDLQLLGEGASLVGGCTSGTAPFPASSDMSTLDESTFKVCRLSVEERKEKIHRYMKKRNERNFSKKIKYACRKTLADSRPRVRGRFAKNDEFGEAAARINSTHHEYDEDEEVVVKEEDMLDSSDIFAHISGVNSFKYNFTLESWI